MTNGLLISRKRKERLLSKKISKYTPENELEYREIHCTLVYFVVQGLHITRIDLKHTVMILRKHGAQLIQL